MFRKSKPDQQQEAKENSFAAQAGRDIVIHQGPSIEEVKRVSLEVFRENFHALGQEAARTANIRIEDFNNKLFPRLFESSPEIETQANDPDFQCAVLEAQMSYARSGSEDLGTMLSDLIVERCKKSKNELVRITLNEAIRTVPKLTTTHLDILSVVFLIRYCIRPMKTLSDLGNYFDRIIKPYVGSLVVSPGAFGHLQFAGCGSQVTFASQFGNFMHTYYPALFMRGFSFQELEARGLLGIIPNNFFMKNLDNANLIQFSAMNNSVLEDMLRSLNLNPDVHLGATMFYREKTLGDKQIEERISQLRDYMSHFIDIWNTSKLSIFELTSVGIAIGHARASKSIGGYADLIEFLQ